MWDNRMNRTEISNGQPERPPDLSLSRISNMCHSWPREVYVVMVAVFALTWCGQQAYSERTFYKVKCLWSERTNPRARSQNLWVQSIRKSGVVSCECAGRAALS